MFNHNYCSGGESPVKNTLYPTPSASVYHPPTSEKNDFKYYINPLSVSQEVFSPQRMQIDTSNQVRGLR